MLYVWGYANSRSIDGILVKADSGVMYLLNVQENHDEWGTIGLIQQAKEMVDQTKLNTGDHVTIQGDLEILESWPLQYVGIKRILVNQKYDGKSLQTVKEAVERLGYEELWHGQVVYPE